MCFQKQTLVYRKFIHQFEYLSFFYYAMQFNLFYEYQLIIVLDNQLLLAILFYEMIESVSSENEEFALILPRDFSRD